MASPATDSGDRVGSRKKLRGEEGREDRSFASRRSSVCFWWPERERT
jgi:hypothetical protein